MSELFPHLKEIGAHLTDSNTSMCSESSEAAREDFAMHFGPPPNCFSRDSSTMSNISTSSIGSISSTASKRKKKKAAIWAEKYEFTAVVMGPVVAHDKFKDLVSLVKDKCGEIKSHYYRDEQACGFIYFHSETNADKCKMIMNGFVFDGNVMKASSPSHYFENEDDAYPDTNTSTNRPSRRGLLATPTQLLPSSSTSSMTLPLPAEPTSTLVIKNLCFGLKQEKLLEFMANLEFAPQSVSYHYDNNGLFRGVAFAKYSSAEQAENSLKELQGTEVSGRKLRVEFKRRTTLSPGLLSPLKQMSFDSALSPLRPMTLKPEYDFRRQSAPAVPKMNPDSDGIVKLENINGSFSASMPERLSPGGENIAPMTPPRVRITPDCVSSPLMAQQGLPSPILPHTPGNASNAVHSFFRAIPSSPVVIRAGLEFEDAPPMGPMFQLPNTPPPNAQFNCRDSTLAPVLRAGFEFV